MSETFERIKAFHSSISAHSSEEKAEVRELYQSLSPDEVRQLADWTVESDDSDIELYILSHLACYKPGSLAPFHGRMIERTLFFPALLFFGASEETTDRLLKAVAENDGSDTLSTNHMLAALAWIGNESVQKTFDSWRRTPPSCASSLHVPPYAYALGAGWELTEEGGSRDLFLRDCHHLFKPDDVNASPTTLGVALENDEACSWCNQPMTTMLDIDLSRPEIAFLGIRGERLRLATCHGCACFGTIFTKIDFNGKSEWHRANEQPDYLPDDIEDCPRLPAAELAFGRRQRHWMEAANWCYVEPSASQVGGYPTWIQDAFYPKCPECGQLMVFYAQLAVEDIDEYGEGIFYMHLCRSCGVSATHFQQS